jgi:colicin import membrane protein
MQKEFIELIAKSTETAMESARKMSELNMRTFETLLQQQADMIGAYLDMTTKSMEAMTKAKGVQELIEGQTQLSREFGERGVAMVRKGMAVANETGTEYSNLVQEGVKTAQEQMAAAAAALKVA